MSNAELLSNLAQVARIAALVEHDRSAADDFQVRDLGQVREDFILNSVREIRVLFVVAQIFEWQYRNRLDANLGGPRR